MLGEYFVGLFLIAFSISSWGIYFLRQYLLKKQILNDIPVERSNHKIATPKGAGIIIVIGFIFIWLKFNIYFSIIDIKEVMMVCLCMLILSIISFYDDVKDISQLPRLFVHIISAMMVVQYFHRHNIFFPIEIMPPVLEKLLLILAFAYFINIYNFMDGIDGITAINTITISIGLGVMFYLYGISNNLLYSIFILVGLMFGFLIFNWHPAKIFIGDVGSIPLGFIIGYLNFNLSMNGHLPACILLNSYYIFDASYTLIKRIMRGEKFWMPHSEHIFQIAVRSGKSHSYVSLCVGIFNIFMLCIVISFKEYL